MRDNKTRIRHVKMELEYLQTQIGMMQENMLRAIKQCDTQYTSVNIDEVEKLVDFLSRDITLANEQFYFLDRYQLKQEKD